MLRSDIVTLDWSLGIQRKHAFLVKEEEESTTELNERGSQIRRATTMLYGTVGSVTKDQKHGDQSFGLQRRPSLTNRCDQFPEDSFNWSCWPLTTGVMGRDLFQRYNEAARRLQSTKVGHNTDCGQQCSLCRFSQRLSIELTDL